MQLDFHYYATYCAAFIAGYTHGESLEIAYSAQFTDCCSETLLESINAPKNAATTQLQTELMNSGTDLVSRQKITRIWSAFHFLPGNLNAERKGCTAKYLRKYRLICNVNSDLLVRTVGLARDKNLQAAGLAMHILADTWAHRYFAGTPSLVINSTDYYFYELVPETEGFSERRIIFNHNPKSPDDASAGKYTATVSPGNENSVMNLGHGRAGHLPDYSYARYRYMPAWAGYEEVIKDNPEDYYNAFCQMIYALKYLRGKYDTFEKDRYDYEAADPWKEEIRTILVKRQTDASADWKAFAEKLSGCGIEDFDQEKYQQEYLSADAEARDSTVLGKFISAAVTQKNMVVSSIFDSGNRIAGIPAGYEKYRL